ncbi:MULTISPECIES: hypothetical protein [unclassified Streptomyces]|uniref:hypothetical protein n=1 Tax=unclassified Streptomyces TaxID=2593676 RepID=UPI0013A6D4A2|nr:MULTISPECIES: hypothetical protein [unclassified Streptomyces]
MGTEERQRAHGRHTPRTWLANRRFRHLDRPDSLSGARAQQQIDYLARKLGSRHPDTLRARETLAFWLSREGFPAVALSLTEAEVADRTAESGPGHPDTLRARGNLVRYRRATGDLPGAIADLQALLEDTTRFLGADDQETHRHRRHLAELLGEAGDTDEEIGRLRTLLAEEETLGAAWEEAARITRSPLARALERRGDFVEALALVEQLVAAERVKIYGIDENLTQAPLRWLIEWRDRLAALVRRAGQSP